MKKSQITIDNTSAGALGLLNFLVVDNIIDMNDYYSTSLGSRGNVQLQGYFSSSIITGFRKQYTNSVDLTNFEKSVDDNGFVSISFRYKGNLVEVTLT